VPEGGVVNEGSDDGAALAPVGCDVGICSRGAGVGVGADAVGVGAGVAVGVGVGSGAPPQPANNNAMAQPMLAQVA
jgi:hypothetical protein